VGLVLACLLGQRGRSVSILEKNTQLPTSSMAIGITPPSLEVLQELGLRKEFESRGVQISRAQVFEEGRWCGALEFRPSEKRILSFPQFGTLQILRGKVGQLPTVHLHEGMEATPEGLEACKGWVIGCDGAHSRVREWAGISSERKEYSARFVMADFPDEEQLGSDARLYFSANGAVESFPLPGKRRRWVTQRVGAADASLDTIIDRVGAATGIDLRGREHGPVNGFHPSRSLAQHYWRDQVILCGDAAHTLSPIGGQGMNTGIADAKHLAEVLMNPSEGALHQYEQARKRAFRIASRRAACGMWLGTRTGSMASRLRQATLCTTLSFPATQAKLMRVFSMQDLPATVLQNSV